MAQSPQGPGWWQASDGEWYPPESHPNYQPPAPQGPPQTPPAPYQAPAVPPAYGQQPPPGPTAAYGQLPQGPPPAYPQQPQYAAGAPVPPVAPASGGNKKALIMIAAVLVVLLIAAGVAVVALGGDDDKADNNEVVVGEKDQPTTGGRTGTDPDKSIKEDAPDATAEVDIVGPSDGPENAVASAAIVDLEKFWTDEMPDAYGIDYEPVTGGFYSFSPGEELPPCATAPEDVEQNAFYCGQGDVVAWDDTDLIPHLYETYGDLSVAIVFAHEWGHAIQARAGMDGATVTLEQQADCFAGAWVANVRDGGSEFFTADGPALDQALAGFLEIADTPGTSAQDPNAHGSAFDRINSFQEGLEDGATPCVEYTDDSVAGRLVELEFQTQEDFDAGGNAPYFDEDPCTAEDPSGCGVIGLTTLDLEDYWSKIGEQEGTAWTPLEATQVFGGSAGGSAPDCGGSDTSGYTLFYCVDGRFVAYDEDLFVDVYDSLGDFAVAALYGSQYSLAAQDAFGVAPDDVKEQNLMADCMTGSWAASVFLQDRPESAYLVLSPGDFDEAVKVLLALGSTEEDGGSQGTGFQRVKAFRDGVIGGVGACVE